MPTIEVSEEDLQFLQELAHELRTQDPHGTAAPYFFVVRTWKELVAPSGYGDREVWLTGANSGEPRTFSSDHEAKTKLAAEFEGEELADTIDELQQFGMHRVEESRNVFFTRKGYEEHMRLNDHNYGGVTCREPHPYVEHAFRNPEIRRLLEIVHRLGAEPAEKVYAGVDWGSGPDKAVLSFVKAKGDGGVRIVAPTPTPGTQYPCPICGTKGTWRVRGTEFTHEHMPSPPGPFAFFYDGELRMHNRDRIDGKTLKALFNVDKTYQLFVEKEGDGPDRCMSDDDVLMLVDAPKIYSVPPAAFGKTYSYLIDREEYESDHNRVMGGTLLRLIDTERYRLLYDLNGREAIVVSPTTEFALDGSTPPRFFTELRHINGG